MIYQTSEKEFLAYAKKGNLIPVYREIYGDLETPVAAYIKLSKSSKYSFLLESVEGGEKLARYSFLARDPELVLRTKGRTADIVRFKKGVKVVQKASFVRTPLELVRELISKYNYVNISALPSFCGGLVGYLSYDTVRFFERLPDNTTDDLKLADVVLMLAKDLVVFDHLHHTIKLVACVETSPSDSKQTLVKKYRNALKVIHSLFVTLEGSLPRQKSSAKKASTLKVSCNCTKQAFEKMVVKTKEEIKRGEIIQAVLSQRFEVDVKLDPVRLYRTLRTLNPSPYMYLLNLDGLGVVGSSPELLVRCEQGIVATRPIAGTRPRGKNEAEDLILEKDLLSDPKELAEHVMLVDLGRNDLGRVCQEGSVKVTDLMTVERYSHVMHIVSNVQGQLKAGEDAISAFESVFPAGTLSGAPKVRAMEIIDGLEVNRRGPYGGAIGYFSFSQDLDTCITIRTILLKGNKAYVQAGAGIVADSDPATEYQETVNKAKAQIRALELAAKR